jgi:hypothetical protein
MNSIVNPPAHPHARLTATCLLAACMLLLSACASNQESQSAAEQSANGAAVSTASAPGAAQTSVKERLEGVGFITVETVHGKVLAVDRARKLVTLEGPHGKKVTLTVENTYNLDAAQPGMPFVAKFYEIVTIRRKQPGEVIPAVALDEGIATAEPGQTPGAAVGRSVEVVATITAINTKDNTIDLKGVNGSIETVPVANPANLQQVQVGEEIVIRLTQAVAISLDQDVGA